MSWIVTILAVLGWVVFGLVIIVALLLDLVGLFGNWLILCAVAAAWAISGFDYFGGYTIPILVGLAILGEILETAAAGMGAAKFGGGKGAVVAAVIGCVLGAVIATPLIPIPLIGTLIGACGGAFVGATAYELTRKEHGLEGSARVGVGAALGKVGGLFAKTVVGFVMLGVVAWNF
ncbi:MAG TPA: DUF456 domain-containing protein [Candidatus Hydrogenedentes bacterium]|nr:DUF456 domain-containing protein [Candidatus Hydrogenedentota bacterium]